MSKQKKFFLITFIFWGITILSGCLNSTTPAEEMYEVLERVVEAEKDFEQQQDPLIELEKKEQELYSQIVALGMKEFDQIVNLSNQAISNVEKRREHMDLEEKSILMSKKEFENLPPLIEKLEDPALKKQAQELHETMMTRYDAHDTLYENYTKGLEYDIELYNMFQKEDLSMEELEQQIAKINDTYKIVLESNEVFNEQTNKYNESKLKFYETAGIDVN